jgi:hypothetical protein
VKTSQGDVTIDPKGNAYVNASGKIYLGTKDGKSATYPVMTQGGPSSKVYAVL